ncbi:hypothetical protein ACFIJ5_05645 [Haloimpatiens sp. FM7330]|uniref:hypothetical protein n=1 Tax=Haloimpatiens sp. FM7330 TaxID=3298610 RepID=UPI00363D2508
MAMIHEFILVPKYNEWDWSYDNVVRDSCGEIDMLKSGIKDFVEIHDDIIIYINDTLNWIPSKNPAFEDMPKGFGLNHYGITLFDKESAPIIKNIFSGWIKIFSQAPSKFKLTGEYELGSETYEKIQLERNKVIDSFEKMFLLANKLENENYYLIHLGI